MDTGLQAPASPPQVNETDLRSNVILLNYKVDELRRFMEELKANFATKAELTDVKESVKNIKEMLSWVIKIVIGAVIVGVLGLVISKAGVPHP